MTRRVPVWLGDLERNLGQREEGMAEIERAYTVDRVQRITGLSKRQLQYWEDTGLIRPSLSRPHRRGRGRPRLYDFRDLVELKTAARLRSSVSLQLIRKVRDHLRNLDYEKPLSEVVFEIVDGELFFVESGTVRSGRLPQQIVLHVVVPLRAIVEELTAQLAELDTRRVGDIERRRGVLGGKPVIAGTRIPVATVRRLAQDGLSFAEMREMYPDLTTTDVQAALRKAPKDPRHARRATG